MDRDVFATRFLIAAEHARDFARGFVVEALPEPMMFRVLLNQSNDGTILMARCHRGAAKIGKPGATECMTRASRSRWTTAAGQGLKAKLHSHRSHEPITGRTDLGFA